MQVNQLKRHTAQKAKKVVGRGGKRGTTSGRGTKGQRARSGRKLRPELRDIIKKVPKKRGYRFQSFQTKPTTVSTDQLEKVLATGARVTPATLLEKKLIIRQNGKIPMVKILSGRGPLTKKFSVNDCTISASAKIMIEKAGGSVK